VCVCMRVYVFMIVYVCVYIYIYIHVVFFEWHVDWYQRRVAVVCVHMYQFNDVCMSMLRLGDVHHTDTHMRIHTRRIFSLTHQTHTHIT
jgi:hypothetical protein